jgi:hypothetical protein
VAPTASLIAGNVTSGGGDSFQFTINYSDNRLLSSATIGNGDVQVIGPNGFVQTAKLVSKTPAKNSNVNTAIYRITPPRGLWDAADNGAYTVAVIAKQVADAAGNFVLAGALGQFSVDVPV